MAKPHDAWLPEEGVLGGQQFRASYQSPAPRPAALQAAFLLSEPRMTARTICLAIRVIKNTLSDTRSKVRMAILRIIGQLALSGFQDKIKGWGLKYVSVQLTLSTYKLVSVLTWSRRTSEPVCKALEKERT